MASRSRNAAPGNESLGWGIRQLLTIDRAMTKNEVERIASRWLGMLTLAALLGGCTGLRPAQVENGNTYVLAATPLANGARAKRDLVLEVSAPRAWPGFETPQMAYVQRHYELDYFATNRWADTPSRMLGPLLAQALEQTGSFRAVVQTPTVVPADLRVISELIRLQQNFGTHPSRVELTLRAQLIDVRGKRMLASRLFDETENAPSDDAYGGVTAANLALQRILEQVADFCVVGSGTR
jgi:cholesterol transport system auxiliary component